MFAEEISRQLINSDAQLLFGLASMSGVLNEAVAMTKRPIRIVYVKENRDEALPAGGINLQDLISTDGENLLGHKLILIFKTPLLSRD